MAERSADLTPEPLRHIRDLFPAVRPLPFPLPDVQALGDTLRGLFPDTASRDYLSQLMRGKMAPIRLFALSCLPVLLDQAGLDTTAFALCRDENSRPYLRQLHSSRIGTAVSVDFNLSHSAAHVACMLWLGGGRIGVDIEEPVPADRVGRLASRLLSSDECAILREPQHVSAEFTRIWTRREALCKQDGKGQPLLFDSSAPPSGVRLESFCLPDSGAYLSVCLPA